VVDGGLRRTVGTLAPGMNLWDVPLRIFVGKGSNTDRMRDGEEEPSE
jgi:hypothetical protein